MGETKKATAVGDMLPGTLDMLSLGASRGEAAATASCSSSTARRAMC
jgi:hypothetical protein